nr:hypothetical protein JVH1_9242 [Rhodococcus sp. JVH1]
MRAFDSEEGAEFDHRSRHKSPGIETRALAHGYANNQRD